MKNKIEQILIRGGGVTLYALLLTASEIFYRKIFSLPELEKIIEKLRYYGVEKKIKNISEYLQNRTQTEIDNILSMNYEKHVNVNANTK